MTPNGWKQLSNTWFGTFWVKVVFAMHDHCMHAWSAPPPQSPTYNVGHVYTLFLQSFNIVLGGGGWVGGEAAQFKTDNSR